MSDAYLFYQAGQAVAAAHLGLKVKRVTSDPAVAASDFGLPKNDIRAQIILWLTGLAAEKRGARNRNALRRMRARVKIRAMIEEAKASLPGTRTTRLKHARRILSQSQDRSAAIAINLYAAIQEVVEVLRREQSIEGAAVVEIVRKVKAARLAGGASSGEEAAEVETAKGKGKGKVVKGGLKGKRGKGSKKA